MRYVKAKVIRLKDKGERTKPWRPALLPLSFILFPLAFALLAAPACSTTKGTVKKDPDPLLGDTAPKKSDPLTTQAKSVPPVPPVPLYQTSVSTAGLAAALPLDGGRPPLAIPNDSAKTGANSGTWTGQTPPGSFNANPPAAGAPQPVPVLGAPQPIPMPVPVIGGNNSATDHGSIPAPGGIAFAAEVAPVATPSYEQLQLELQKRGMIWQKAEQLPNSVRFSCGVAHPQNANAERFIQTEGPNVVTAIQAALVQIDGPPR